MPLDHPPVDHDERVDENGNWYPYGRCDTCGAPCDKNGCTKNQNHEIAIPG